MKVLKRITLKSVSEYLSDKEMRNVVGGDYGGSGTYDDPYQLPEVVIKGDPCDSLPSCGDPGKQYCMGKRCGESCTDTTTGRTGTCKAWPGLSTCKICNLG